VGSYAENQKIAAVRKVYQKGIMTPMVSVELLWKDYCTYEMVSYIIKRNQTDYFIRLIFRVLIQY